MKFYLRLNVLAVLMHVISFFVANLIIFSVAAAFYDVVVVVHVIVVVAVVLVVVRGIAGHKYLQIWPHKKRHFAAKWGSSLSANNIDDMETDVAVVAFYAFGCNTLGQLPRLNLTTTTAGTSCCHMPLATCHLYNASSCWQMEFLAFLVNLQRLKALWSCVQAALETDATFGPIVFGLWHCQVPLLGQCQQMT